MAKLTDDYAAIRNEPDPLVRAARATHLMEELQQHIMELARIRAEGVEAARSEGFDNRSIANVLSLDPSRITRVLKKAPKPYRAFYGVGPIEAFIYDTADGSQELTQSRKDDIFRTRMIKGLLDSLGFTARPLRIEEYSNSANAQDSLIVGDPRNSVVAKELIDGDPLVSFSPAIDTLNVNIHGRYRSFKVDDLMETKTELVYVSRRVLGSRAVVYAFSWPHNSISMIVSALLDLAPECWRTFGDAELTAVKGARWVEANELMLAPEEDFHVNFEDVLVPSAWAETGEVR